MVKMSQFCPPHASSFVEMNGEMPLSLYARDFKSCSASSPSWPRPSSRRECTRRRGRGQHCPSRSNHRQVASGRRYTRPSSCSWRTTRRPRSSLENRRGNRHGRSSRRGGDCSAGGAPPTRTCTPDAAHECVSTHHGFRAFSRTRAGTNLAILAYMMQTVRALTWVASVAVASSACGGSTFESSGNDGGTATDSGSDGGAANPACPAAIPSTGGACSSEGIACEYGIGSHLGCNTVARCSDGAWYVTAPDPMATNCGPTPVATCPTTYGGVPKGTACTESGLECSYSEATCGCTIPEGPPMFFPDGGEPQTTWICVTPPAGCPDPRPHLGTACSSPGLYCDYGTCTFSDGEAESCTDGYWQGEPAGCPAAASGN
jgi:hypothetical protein